VAYTYAQTVDEIAAALNVIDQYDLRAVLVGAHQADEIAEAIVKRELPVICSPLLLHSKDKDLRRVAKLANAGVTIAFASFASKTDAGDIRTSAILAVRYGLDREAALRALTLTPAKMLGLGDRLGSIQKDRDADLVVLDGDPLEPTSQIDLVIVDGKIVYQRE
jgi:imidazolonepropionase-like amidohydrolase